MCVVSNIGDSWRVVFPERYPWYPLDPYVPMPSPMIPDPVDPSPSRTKTVTHPTQEEFDALKHEIEELKLLLKAAKRFDEETKQADCELDEKVALIKSVAAAVGVDMNDVFVTKKKTKKQK